MTVGYALGQRGKFFLYRIGKSESLICITEPTTGPLGEDSKTYDYSPGQGKIPSDMAYNCVTTALGTRRAKLNISSDIYVGGDKGIWMFKNAGNQTMQKVTDRISDVHEIVVREDDRNISIWAVASPNQLWYIAGVKSGGNGPYKWNNPILFSHSVIHIAPIRSMLRKANELFAVDQHQSIVHYWQDPGSTLWQQRTMRVKGSDFLIDLDTYTTQVHVQDKNSMPMAGVKLAVTASEWTYVTANGLVYSLDKDNAAMIPTDGGGNVTVIAMASNIATPILHVESDSFQGVLNVYPNGKVHKGLQAIQHGADLKGAVTQDGKQVIDPSHHLDGKTLDASAYNIKQMTAAGDKYEKTGDNTFLSVSTGKHTGALAMAQIPENFSVAMKLENGAWVHGAGAASPLFTQASVVDDIEDFAGDALHWMETAFVDGFRVIEKGVVKLEDGVEFVIKKVEEGLQFVLKLADKVLNVVLDTLGAVFRAVNWLLKLIGIDLSKVLAWLGHLFGWDDIWKTHKAIASVMKAGLDYMDSELKTELDKWQKKIDKELSGVGDKIKNLALPPWIANKSPGADRKKLHENNPHITGSSPPVSFTHYQMQHGGMIAGPATALVANSGFGDFIETIEKTVEDLAKNLFKDFMDLKNLITEPNHAYENMVNLLADIAETVVEVIKDLLDGFFKFVEDIFGDLKKSLEDEIEIPFLGSLYEFITGLLGEKEKLTVINATALLIAIPLTVLYKASTGHAPLKGVSGLKDSRLFDELSGTKTPAFQMLAEMQSPAMAPEAAPKASIGAVYSRFGGAFGSIAGVGGGIANWIVAYDSTYAAKPGKLNPAQKVALGFNIAKLFGTFPVKGDKQPESAYVLKQVAYWILVVFTFVQTMFQKPTIKAGSAAAVNAIVLILAVIADAVGKNNAGTFIVDISSNVCGAGGNICTAIEQEEIGVFFRAFGLLAAIGGMALSIATAEEDVVQLVNPGGI